jgi:acyl-homoserine-lactone acylase
MIAYDQLPQNDTLKTLLKDPIQYLSKWDLKSSPTSVATSLALLWGSQMITHLPPPLTEESGTDQRGRMYTLAQASPDLQLKTLQQVISQLTKDHGTWKIPWGNLCRYQRVGTGMVDGFNDLQPSKPVGMAPSLWGSLPAVALRKPQGSKYFYGVGGNSFVAAVEFGPRLKAKTIVTGGHSNDPASAHYQDQSDGFLNGQLKDIRFYPEEVKAHAKRSYKIPY